MITGVDNPPGLMVNDSGESNSWRSCFFRFLIIAILIVIRRIIISTTIMIIFHKLKIELALSFSYCF